MAEKPGPIPRSSGVKVLVESRSKKTRISVKVLSKSVGPKKNSGGKVLVEIWGKSGSEGFKATM